MAQPLIKFFRVAKIADLQATQKVQGGLYFETETGILYVYNGTAFEAYSGLKSASFADEKLVLTPSVGAAIEIDLSGYVSKEQTIADIDLQDNITAEELRDALGLTTAEENVLEGVKVNGEALTIAADKTVDILVAEGATNGTIAVSGKDVAVHGLGSAAYTDAGAYDAYGSAAKALEDANDYTDGVKDAIIGDATTAGDTLGKLEDRIEAIVTNEKTYSVVKLTAAEVTALGNSNVKEAYRLIDEDKAAVGDPILIYKDSSLKSAAMGTGDNAQKLMLTYILADGSESVVPVDLSAFYAESETGAGLQLIDHVISVKLDAASEAFLTVSADGVKLSGVQDAINAAKNAAIAEIAPAIAALDATVGSQTVADGKHVAVEVVETDGKLTSLTIVENDIASAQATETALNDLTERIEAVADSIPTELGVMSVVKGTDGKFVTTTIGGTAADPTVGVAVSYTESTAEATALATDAYVQEQIAASALTWQLF